MSGRISICTIVDEAKEAIKDFRFRKNENTSALILKVVREKHEIHVDEKLDHVENLEELKDYLPEHQPRYIILSYKQKHCDGRISYPICFIFYTPRDSQIDLQMMYAGSKVTLQKEADISRGYEIRELDEMNEEWLHEKLGN